MIERLLIVGHGSIGKRHLGLARELLPKADIRILRHRSCTNTPELADGCFGNLPEACKFEPQAAVIANPAPFHINTALALAEINCHLLVEKPLSHIASGIDELLKLVQARNLVLQVGYNLRFQLSLQEYQARINAGAIGRVLSVRCEVGQNLTSWRPDTDYREGVSARYELGGGVLLELSHELDYLRWIFGEVTWVSAWLGRQSALDIDVEDTAHLRLGFERDSEGRSLLAVLSLDFIRHDFMRVCTAIGELGSLRWNGQTGEVEEYLAGSTGWRLVFHHDHQRDDCYRAQWQHFLTCVQSGSVPLVSGADGLAVLSIIEGVRASSGQKGTRVAVNIKGVYK